MRSGSIGAAAATFCQPSAENARSPLSGMLVTRWRVIVALVSLCSAIPVSIVVAGDGRLMSPMEGPPQSGQFELPDIHGQVRRLSDYQGRFLLVNFWATWCAPCREEMPSLNLLGETFAGAGLDVVAIHVGPAGEEMHQFLEHTPVDFTVLVDEAMTSMSDWKVVGIPVTYLVGRDGRMLYRAVGERDWASAEMKRFMKRVIE